MAETSDDRGNADLLLSALSHDLRGPLSTISALAHTLHTHDEQLDRDTRRDLLRRIAGKADALTTLVTEVLDLTRFEGGQVSAHRERVALRSLLEQVIRTLDDGNRVTVDVPDLGVEVDVMMTGRMVTNLVDNALKHTGPDAQVWVTAAAVTEGLELRVEDDGPGVPEQQREHLFDAFHATTSDTGMGYGLAVVARFARLQGGEVSVSDRPGGGASFRVFLPTETFPAADADGPILHLRDQGTELTL